MSVTRTPKDKEVELSAVDNAVLDSIDSKASVIGTDTTSIDGKITACNTGAIIGTVSVTTISGVVAGTVTANLSATDNAVLDSIDARGIVSATNLVSLDGKVTACNTGAIVGTVTANLSAVDNTVLDNIDTSLNNIETGQLADGHNVGVNNGTLASAVNIQDGGNSITVDGTLFGTISGSVSGTVTANLSATDNAVLDSIDTRASVIATAVGAIQTGQLADGHNVAVANGTLASAVNIQDGGNSLTVDGTLTATVSAVNLDIRDLTATDVVTANLSAVDNTVLDNIQARAEVIGTDTTSIDGKITACNTGAIAGTVTANLSVVDNTVLDNIQLRAEVIGTDTTSIDGKITACDTGAIVGTVSITGTVSGTLDVAGSVSNTIDTNNSTTATLGGAGVFTGTGTDVSTYTSITTQLATDVDSATDGMTFQFSTDDTNWDEVHSFTMDVSESTTRRFQFPVTGQYYRVVYTNGGGAQSYFRVQTILHKNNVLTSIHRVSDELTTDRSATLTRSVIAGQTTAGGGAMVNVKVNPSGTMECNVSQDDAANLNATVTGTVTSALSAVDNAVLDNIQARAEVIATDTTSIDGKITACNTGAIAGTVTANLSSVDNTVLDNIQARAETIGTDTTSIDGKITACDTGNVAGTVTANLSATDNAVLDSIDTSAIVIATDTTSIDGKITACDTGAIVGTVTSALESTYVFFNGAFPDAGLDGTYNATTTTSTSDAVDVSRYRYATFGFSLDSTSTPIDIRFEIQASADGTTYHDWKNGHMGAWYYDDTSCATEIHEAFGFDLSATWMKIKVTATGGVDGSKWFTVDNSYLQLRN